MTYLQALYQFTLEFKNLEDINFQEKNLVFPGSSAIVGLLMILLDFGAYFLKGESFLGMHYNKKSKYFAILIVWTLASAIVSYLGIIMSIFNSTIQSCVIVGATWLLLFAKIANQAIEPDEIQH